MKTDEMLIYCGKISVDDVRKIIAKVNDVADKTNSTVVLFDAEKTAGTKHIESAVFHAKRSFANGRGIARSLSMEILVYASGQRQCSIASKFGLHEGDNSLYVLILGGDTPRAKEMMDSIVSECPPFALNEARLKETFGITDDEMEAAGKTKLVELVIERVALVDAWK